MDKREVICISSGDEEDTQQNGDTVAEALPSKTRNNISSSLIKVDLSEDDLKANVSVSKRMTNQEDTNSNFPPKKKRKLSSNGEEEDTNGSGTDMDCNESESTSEPNDKQNKTVLKPKLVEKKRQIVSEVVQDTFPMFISLCLQKDHSEDMKAIVNKLKRKYEELDPVYTGSKKFIEFLNEKRNAIVNSKKRLYVYIQHVMNEMKQIRNGTSSLLPINDKRKTNEPQPTTSTSTNCSNNDNTVETDDADYEKGSNTEWKIEVLEQTMAKCEKKIKHLEQLEINFDDENNSDYIKLEKFKYRMVELYNKYCELTGNNADAERSYLRPKYFKTTGIEAVDMAISSFINSKISKNRKTNKVGSFANALIFPDYRDILQCVKHCNKNKNLGLNEKDQAKIARKAFADLGDRLQRARHDDFLDTFSLLLEEEDEDPALKDPLLAEKLMRNKKEGELRLGNLFEEYTKKQEEAKDKNSENKKSDDDDNEDEGDESSESEVASYDSNDNVSEISSVDEEDDNLDTCISVNGEKPSTSINDAIVTSKPSAGNGKTNKDIEIDANLKKDSNALCTVEKSNANGHNNLKSSNAERVVSTLNCENNPKSQVQKTVNDVTSLSHLSLPTEVKVSTVTNSVNTGRTEEDEPKIVCEDSIDNMPEEEDKPLLRVCSFAKPPTTWQDERQRADGVSVDGSASKVVTVNAIVDLTNETPKQRTAVSKYETVQIAAKRLCVRNGKCTTLLIPKGKTILNVENITNNYVRLSPQKVGAKNAANPQTATIIKSQRVVHSPSDLSTHPGTANIDKLIKSSEMEKKNAIVRIKQINKILFVGSNQAGSKVQSTTINLTPTNKK